MATEIMPDGEQAVSLTELRKNVYQLVDDIITTGKPLAVKRGDTLLKLDIISRSESKLGNLKKRNTLADSAVDIEAEQLFEWNPDNGFD